MWSRAQHIPALLSVAVSLIVVDSTIVGVAIASIVDDLIATLRLGSGSRREEDEQDAEPETGVAQTRGV